MGTFLDRLHDLKLKEVAQRQIKISEKILHDQVETLGVASAFRSCLLRAPGEPISLISEVKSRAPGRNNVDRLVPEDVVSDFEAGGAKAISVLTDEKWFGGSLETLEKAHRATALPLLHKDFIVTSYQLLEGRVRGASAALILAYYFQETEIAGTAIPQDLVVKAQHHRYSNKLRFDELTLQKYKRFGDISGHF